MIPRHLVMSSMTKHVTHAMHMPSMYQQLYRFYYKPTMMPSSKKPFSIFSHNEIYHNTLHGKSESKVGDKYKRTKQIKKQLVKERYLTHEKRHNDANLGPHQEMASYEDQFPIRVNKYLSKLGITSRRVADALITDGKVKINGKIAELGDKVAIDSKVFLEGENVSPSKHKAFTPRLWMYYKPVGCLTSTYDPKGRPTVYDFLEGVLGEKSNDINSFHELKPVGRLDMTSEGLLLFTNDGHLKRYLELPTSRIERVYMVKISGNVTDAYLQQVQNGAMIEGTKYGKLKIYIHKRISNSKCWIKVHLFEGKNREIRRLLKALNLHVIRLKRIQYGPYVLPKSFQPNNITQTEVPQSLIKLANAPPKPTIEHDIKIT